jgi:SapC
LHKGLAYRRKNNMTAPYLGRFFMTEAQNNGEGPIAGRVILYQNPQPLALETHGKLGLKNIDRPFAFVEQTHFVPLTVQEFGVAATCMPIIFSPDKKTALAVLASRSGENLFVSKDGDWEVDAYVPAFIRRYPFIFAADDQNENFVVCIDEGAPMIGENADIPFFENGEPTAYTKGALEFLQDFERQRRATDDWIALVNEMDLLEEKSVTFTPSNPDGSQGETIKIADYIAVSEEKLQALPQDKFLKLKETGAMGAIYAHLVSLLQWQKLVQRTLRLNNAAPAANA